MCLGIQMAKSQQDILHEEQHIIKICNMMDQKLFSNVNRTVVSCTKLDYRAKYKASSVHGNFTYEKGVITKKKSNLK